MKTIKKGALIRAAIKGATEISTQAKGRPIDTNNLSEEDLKKLEEAANKLREVAARHNNDTIRVN